VALGINHHILGPYIMVDDPQSMKGSNTLRLRRSDVIKNTSHDCIETSTDDFAAE
jgi:hypothetical protein